MKPRGRCSWAENDPLMAAYHDEEWGVPQRDSRMLWEMLMLEGFSGRAFVDHRAAQARGVSESVQELRSEKKSRASGLPISSA